jgi:hypothetical protein
MGTVSVSMKLTPKQAGALYVKTMRLEDQVKALIVERDQLADHLAKVLQTYGDNSGFEPSLSVFQREIDRARDYMAKRQGGAV